MRCSKHDRKLLPQNSVSLHSLRPTPVWTLVLPPGSKLGSVTDRGLGKQKVVTYYTNSHLFYGSNVQLVDSFVFKFSDECKRESQDLVRPQPPEYPPTSSIRDRPSVGTESRSTTDGTSFCPVTVVFKV